MTTRFKDGSEFLVKIPPLDLGVNLTNSKAFALANGKFGVTWAAATATSQTDIRAQMFSADGTKAGSGFVLNSTLAGGQLAPDIVALADGGFVAI